MKKSKAQRRYRAMFSRSLPPKQSFGKRDTPGVVEENRAIDINDPISSTQSMSTQSAAESFALGLRFG
jgi:hypothetical protein